nr:small, acid-soluble spore protein, alpha/beta type [Sedimentibacter sp.]
MTEKNSIAPEARQALADFKMEMSGEIGTDLKNSMSLSEYPLDMNDLDPEDISLDNEIHNRYLF